MSIATDIADVFNHVHQSHRDDEPNSIVLADAAQRMAVIFAEAGYGTAEAFLDIATMSGLWLDDGPTWEVRAVLNTSTGKSVPVGQVQAHSREQAIERAKDYGMLPAYPRSFTVSPLA